LSPVSSRSGRSQFSSGPTHSIRIEVCIQTQKNAERV
jgi:hypothetical protein